MPIIYNLYDKDKADIVYSNFCKNWEWEKMDFYYEGEDEFYLGMLMCAAVRMNDIKRAESYLEVYKKETNLREYPLILSDCAWVILGTKELADYYREIELTYSD